jgi:hypothetical protein
LYSFQPSPYTSPHVDPPAVTQGRQKVSQLYTVYHPHSRSMPISWNQKKIHTSRMGIQKKLIKTHSANRSPQQIIKNAREFIKPKSAMTTYPKASMPFRFSPLPM